MAMKLVNGDYVCDTWGGFETVMGVEETIGRIVYKLTAHRGGFPLMPELGSELYKIMREKPSRRLSMAQSCVLQCIADENGVELDKIELVDMGDMTAMLNITFNIDGGAYTAQLEARE